MIESTAKLKSVRDISERYGITEKTVREMCNARGQKFAFKLKEGGRYYINERRFREYLERKRREV